jgi:hypothetical protein
LSNVPKENDFNIKNSFECVEILNQTRVPDGYMLVSLDVIQLFPSIPLNLITRAIEKRWTTISEYTSITLTYFLELINLCYNYSYCQYDNKYFRQLKGLPMGSGLSPIVSDLVMTDLIKNTMEKLEFRIPLILKYVDDLVLLIPKDKQDIILTTFNNYCRKIQFTMETEIDNELPYLDILIKRTETNELMTEFYMKPSSSGRLVNYLSNHPYLHKTNIVLGLIHSVVKLDNVRNELEKHQKIKMILQKNNYPKSLINSLIKRYKIKNTMTTTPQLTMSTTSALTTSTTEDTATVTTSTNTITEENTITPLTNLKYRSIPYIKGLSEKTKKLLQQNNNDLTIAFRNNYNNSIFSSIKDKNDKWNKTNIIYSVPCGVTECDSEYVGMTTTSLKKRISGHESDIKNRNNQMIAKTALCQHTIEKGHLFDFEKTKILNQEKNLKKLTFLEMLHINDRPTCVNKKN